MNRWKRSHVAFVIVAAGGLAFSGMLTTRAADKAAKADPALEHARKEVKMLDDVYKTAVVLITENYVTEDSDLPAGSAAKALFAAIEKKGWHTVRLIDVTGQPYSDENVAKDAFEKGAAARLKKGEAYVEEVQEKDGKRFLRAATPIPVVLEKCVMCHDHYKDVPKGQAIGMLGYTVPIE
jgi:hypothetical protein